MRQCPLKHKECPLKRQLVGRVVRSFEIQVAKATNGQTDGSAEESSSFRAFQRYLTDKNPSHGRGTASIFQFSSRSF